MSTDHARTAAKQAGERTYRGAACQHGHGTERYTSSSNCVTCTKERAVAAKAARKATTKPRKGKPKVEAEAPIEVPVEPPAKPFEMPEWRTWGEPHPVVDSLVKGTPKESPREPVKETPRLPLTTTYQTKLEKITPVEIERLAREYGGEIVSITDAETGEVLWQAGQAA